MNGWTSWAAWIIATATAGVSASAYIHTKINDTREQAYVMFVPRTEYRALEKRLDRIESKIDNMLKWQNGKRLRGR